MDTNRALDHAGRPRHFTSPDDVAHLAQAIVPDGWEGLFVIGLGCRHELVGVALNDRYRALSALRVHELVDLAAELRAAALIVVVRQTVSREPSAFERRAFAELAARCARAHLPLLDALMLWGRSWWSLSVPRPAANRGPGAGTRPRQSRP